MPWVLRGVEPGDDVLEIGPGRGLTTDLLRRWAPRLTAIEIDPVPADALRRRTAGTNVAVATADATVMPFEDDRFSAAVSFTMLHHVPSHELQSQLLREVHGVLRPGATFAGTDSVTNALFRLAHLFDTMVLVEPDTCGQRLEPAGFVNVDVRIADGAFRFHGIRPVERPRHDPLRSPNKSVGREDFVGDPHEVVDGFGDRERVPTPAPLEVEAPPRRNALTQPALITEDRGVQVPSAPTQHRRPAMRATAPNTSRRSVRRDRRARRATPHAIVSTC